MMQLRMTSESVEAPAFLIGLQAISLLPPMLIVLPPLAASISMDTSSLLAARSLSAALLPSVAPPS
jgi:hypothetical protein